MGRDARNNYLNNFKGLHKVTMINDFEKKPDDVYTAHIKALNNCHLSPEPVISKELEGTSNFMFLN